MTPPNPPRARCYSVALGSTLESVSEGKVLRRHSGLSDSLRSGHRPAAFSVSGRLYHSPKSTHNDFELVQGFGPCNVIQMNGLHGLKPPWYKGFTELCRGATRARAIKKAPLENPMLECPGAFWIFNFEDFTMNIAIAVPLPWPMGDHLRRVVPWVYYGTGWQRLDPCWMSHHQIDYWYARHSAFTAGPSAGITTGTVYFFPAQFSPMQVGQVICSDRQPSLF